MRKSCLRLSFRSVSRLFDSCNTRVLFGKVGNAPCPSQAPFMSFGNPSEGVGEFSFLFFPPFVPCHIPVDVTTKPIVLPLFL